MAKLYMLEEAIGLMAKFMTDYEPLHHKMWREETEVGIVGKVFEGATTNSAITPTLRDVAHDYMLSHRISFYVLCRYVKCRDHASYAMIKNTE